MFRDRHDAGRRLGRALDRFRGDDPLVLALPRGGAPVGYEVATTLDAQLDLVLVRKIGAPGHEELALGAVVDGSHPQLVLNDDVVRLMQPPPGYIEAAEKRELAEIERRRRLDLGGAAPVAIEGRVAIVVVDGVATGATMKAALRGVRRNKPRRLVLAAPVAPASSIDQEQRRSRDRAQDETAHGVADRDAVSLNLCSGRLVAFRAASIGRRPIRSRRPSGE